LLTRRLPDWDLQRMVFGWAAQRRTAVCPYDSTTRNREFSHLKYRQSIFAEFPIDYFRIADKPQGASHESDAPVIDLERSCTIDNSCVRRFTKLTHSQAAVLLEIPQR